MQYLFNKMRFQNAEHMRARICESGIRQNEIWTYIELKGAYRCNVKT